MSVYLILSHHKITPTEAAPQTPRWKYFILTLLKTTAAFTCLFNASIRRGVRKMLINVGKLFTDSLNLQRQGLAQGILYRRFWKQIVEKSKGGEHSWDKNSFLSGNSKFVLHKLLLLSIIESVQEGLCPEESFRKDFVKESFRKDCILRNPFRNDCFLFFIEFQDGLGWKGAQIPSSSHHPRLLQASPTWLWTFLGLCNNSLHSPKMFFITDSSVEPECQPVPKGFSQSSCPQILNSEQHPGSIPCTWLILNPYLIR